MVHANKALTVAKNSGAVLTMNDRHLPVLENDDMSASYLHPFVQDALNKLAFAHIRLQEQQARITLLEQLVYRDDLTGLLNKRAFDDVVNREFDRCRRGHSQGGLLVMIDLDNFKNINDTYGHGAGDACLKAVGRALLAGIRSMDAAARLGGDEFALLLSNADKSEAVNRIQEMAWQLNHLTFSWDGVDIPIRASVGVREFHGDENPADVLHAADASLYACKTHQRQQRSENVTA
jgi:diguanylate cyclase (GGDEF)-like protein